MPPDERNMEQERQLFERLKNDPEVITEIYDRYSGQIFAFVLKRCSHKETAEDVTAQCFIKLLEAAPNLEWKGVPIGAWLYRVVTNALTDHWRRSSTRGESALDTDEWDPPGDDDPAWNVEQTIERARLQQAMDKLSTRDQEVLSLKFYAGYETEEIARELAISNNHAAVLVYRALGRMRKVLISEATV